MCQADQMTAAQYKYECDRLQRALKRSPMMVTPEQYVDAVKGWPSKQQKRCARCKVLPVIPARATGDTSLRRAHEAAPLHAPGMGEHLIDRSEGFIGSDQHSNRGESASGRRFAGKPLPQPPTSSLPRKCSGRTSSPSFSSEETSKCTRTKNDALARSQRKPLPPLPPIMALAATARHTGGRLEGTSAKRVRFHH